jgi:hypothetical protein
MTAQAIPFGRYKDLRELRLLGDPPPSRPQSRTPGALACRWLQLIRQGVTP